MRICINGTTIIGTGAEQDRQVTVNFMTPLFQFGKKDYDWACEEFKSWAFIADTKVLFRNYETGTYQYFVIQVFGFGIGVSRQDGY